MALLHIHPTIICPGRDTTKRDWVVIGSPHDARTGVHFFLYCPISNPMLPLSRNFIYFLEKKARI